MRADANSVFARMLGRSRNRHDMALSKRRKRLIKASVAIVIVLLFLLVIVPYSVSAIVLDVVFGRRFKTKDYLRFSVEDFVGLRSERHTFSSNGQKLVGYRYFSDDIVPKGVVVLAHGFGGGGQNGYMDVSYYFVQNGYEVFGYDATGNDESPNEVNGLPQGIKDLNSAIAYAKKLPQLSSLPMVLWGHSWGGYSALCSLSYNKDVKAVASVAAFNCASDMIEAQGVAYAGSASKILLPYVRSVESMKFGDYASASGVDGIRSSSAGVFIAHGTADTVVPMKYGYNVFYSAFSKSPRVNFSKHTGKGHADILYTSEGWEYTCRIESEIGKASKAERQQLIQSMDRDKFCSRLNTELFEEITEFYDSYTQGT